LANRVQQVTHSTNIFVLQEKPIRFMIETDIILTAVYGRAAPSMSELD